MNDAQVENETLDVCIGVHYATDLQSAKRHFQSVGFNGISELDYLEKNLDCNDCRNRALDAAKRGEGACFWQGAWDYSANKCCLYRFKFTSYNGDRIEDSTGLHVNGELK